MRSLRQAFICALALLLGLSVLAGPARAEEADCVYHVDLASAGVQLSPDLYGIFLEDINYAVDGGLYAELVQNRSFEFFPMKTNRSNPGAHTWAWSETGGAVMTLRDTGGMNENNPHYVTVEAEKPGGGLDNSGYGGIPVTAGEPYRVSFYARGSYAGTCTVRLTSFRETLGETTLAVSASDEWTKLTGTLTAGASAAGAHLQVLLDEPGALDLDMISLFPVHTYNNRENGLRADMVEVLRAMRPGFLRFPGGCIVEGEGLDNAYNWKDSVGDVARRPTIFNRWRNTGTSAYYYQDYGLGFYEYFLLCEDLGCAPLPCLNAGISCYGPVYAPMKDLQPYIDDALDLIEFATGDPAVGEWAALRAEMGHPEPFPLTYLEIGNEQLADDRYYERFDEFERQIHARYPEIRLISSVMGLSNGAGLPTTEWLRGRGTGCVYANDEHFYMSDDWFLTNTYRYDAMERSGDAFIFAGEYACHFSRNNPVWNAVCEAAFMTGFERNGDIVKLSCYAPLFSKQNFTQWQPDLILFSNTDVAGTPSYWVNRMYSTSLPDRTLADRIAFPAPEEAPVSGKVGVGSWNTRVLYDDLLVTDTATGEVLCRNSFEDESLDGWENGGSGRWAVSGGVLGQSAANSIDNALHIGDAGWRNYTYTLRARKISGSEGFIIPFLVQDRDNYYHLNLGGWNNTYSAVERAVNGSKSLAGTSDFVVETGRWYDIRIEVDQTTMKCYVDGVLIISCAFPRAQPIYAAAGLDEDTGDIVLRLVNAAEGSRRVQIALDHADGLRINPTAEMTVLTAAKRNAANSLRNPDSVVPRTEALSGVSGQFTLELPDCSVTVLRIHTRPDSEVVRTQTTIALETVTGAPAELPEAVEVTFADGSVGTKPVAWDHVEPALYACAGIYEIFGSVDGRPDLVRAVVTVSENAR